MQIIPLQFTGNKEEKGDTDVLHRGIANRNFTRTFNIADDVIVNSGSLKNGGAFY